MELGGGFQFQEILNRLAGFLEMGSVKVRDCKVVAVVVGSGIDALGLFEEGDGCRDFSGLSVEFAEIMIGIVIFRLKCNGLFELEFGLIEFSGAGEIGGVVCAGFRGIRLEANGFFKVQDRLSILRLGGVNEAEKFVTSKLCGTSSTNFSSAAAASENGPNRSWRQRPETCGPNPDSGSAWYGPLPRAEREWQNEITVQTESLLTILYSNTAKPGKKSREVNRRKTRCSGERILRRLITAH